MLAEALASLDRQTRPPDRVLVIADNCTDATATVAREHGVEVFETTGNTQHKAGALNQALSAQLRAPRSTMSSSSWTRTPPSRPASWPRRWAASTRTPTSWRSVACSRARIGAGALGQLQRNEFARYQREIDRREGRVSVLTGTASVYSRVRPAGGGAGTRHPHPRYGRRCLRHVGPDRGQRTHAGAEVPRRTDDAPDRSAGSPPRSCRPGGTSGVSDRAGSAARWRMSPPTASPGRPPDTGFSSSVWGTASSRSTPTCSW